MKKYWILLTTLLTAALLAGCGQSREVRLTFPFTAADVTVVKMYYYEGVPASAEMKLVTEQADIEQLYDLFTGLTYQKKEAEPTAGSSVTSFRFCLTDGRVYDLIYAGYGVKNGELMFLMDGYHRLFTSADISWNWEFLNEDLIAEPVEESELPVYPGFNFTAVPTPTAVEPTEN